MIGQHYFTWCPQQEGCEGITGWQTRARSASITPDVENVIKRYCMRYQLPNSLGHLESKGGELSREEFQAAPVAFHQYPVFEGRVGLTRVRLVPKPGGRPGRFFAQTFVLPWDALEAFGFNPFELARSEAFREDAGGAPTALDDLDALPPPRREGGPSRREPEAGGPGRSVDPEQALGLLRCLTAPAAARRPVILCSPPGQDAAALIEAALLLLPARARAAIAFSTYEPDPYRVLGKAEGADAALVQVVATVPPSEGGRFQFGPDAYEVRCYVFNACDGKQSALPEPSPYVRHVGEALKANRHDEIRALLALVGQLRLDGDPERWPKAIPAAGLFANRGAEELPPDAWRTALNALTALADSPPSARHALDLLWRRAQPTLPALSGEVGAAALGACRELLGRAEGRESFQEQARPRLAASLSDLLVARRYRTASALLALAADFGPFGNRARAEALVGGVAAAHAHKAHWPKNAGPGPADPAEAQAFVDLLGEALAAFGLFANRAGGAAAEASSGTGSGSTVRRAVDSPSPVQAETRPAALFANKAAGSPASGTLAPHSVSMPDLILDGFAAAEESARLAEAWQAIGPWLLGTGLPGLPKERAAQIADALAARLAAREERAAERRLLLWRLAAGLPAGDARRALMDRLAESCRADRAPGLAAGEVLKALPESLDDEDRLALYARLFGSGDGPAADIVARHYAGLVQNQPDPPVGAWKFRRKLVASDGVGLLCWECRNTLFPWKAADNPQGIRGWVRSIIAHCPTAAGPIAKAILDGARHEPPAIAIEVLDTFLKEIGDADVRDKPLKSHIAEALACALPCTPPDGQRIVQVAQGVDVAAWGPEARASYEAAQALAKARRLPHTAKPNLVELAEASPELPDLLAKLAERPRAEACRWLLTGLSELDVADGVTVVSALRLVLPAPRSGSVEGRQRLAEAADLVAERFLAELGAEPYRQDTTLRVRALMELARAGYVLSQHRAGPDSAPLVPGERAIARAVGRVLAKDSQGTCEQLWQHLNSYLKDPAWIGQFREEALAWRRERRASRGLLTRLRHLVGRIFGGSEAPEAPPRGPAPAPAPRVEKKGKRSRHG